MPGLALSPLSKLTAGARIKQYPKNQMLLYGGDTVSEVYVLRKGTAKMYDIDQQGNEKVLHIIKPPCLMPLTALRGAGQVTEWFYGSITDCEVYAIPYAEAERRMAADSRLTEYLLRQIAGETHELLVRVSSLGKTDARGKLAYVLRFLAVCHANERRGSWRRVTFPVSQQLLADMIGMTRESTAINMKRLRELGIIRYPRATILEIHFAHLLAWNSATA